VLVSDTQLHFFNSIMLLRNIMFPLLMFGMGIISSLLPGGV
jgi:hypothetical protein